MDLAHAPHTTTWTVAAADGDWHSALHDGLLLRAAPGAAHDPPAYDHALVRGRADAAVALGSRDAGVRWVVADWAQPTPLPLGLTLDTADACAGRGPGGRLAADDFHAVSLRPGAGRPAAGAGRGATRGEARGHG